MIRPETTPSSICHSREANDGKIKIYSPKTGKLIHTATWDAGVLSGEEEGFDETTSNRVLQATLANGKYDGEFTRYVPDGKQIIYQANFVHGQHDGDEESFDPQTGKMTGEAHYASGKLQGVVRHWNADGKLLDEKTYDNGVDVEAAKKEAADKDADREADQALNDPAISGSISKLRGACKEANNTNVDSNEMILAWRDQCQKQSAAAQPGSPQAIPAQPSSAQAVSMSNASNGTPAASVNQVVSDGPAAKRFGWIENDMPSSLTLRDRDGTWSISSVNSQADGLAQMPETNKGNACGCLTVETNRHSMRVIKVLDGKILPVETCQSDKSLGSSESSR